jgi:hypothetical protein
VTQITNLTDIEMAHEFLQFLYWGLGKKCIDIGQIFDIIDIIWQCSTLADSIVHDYQQEGFL